MIQDPANYVDPEVVNDSRNIQMLTSIFVFILPTIAIAFLVTKNKLKYLQINNPVKPLIILMGVATIIASLPIINYIGELNAKIPLGAFLKDMEDKNDAIEAAFQLHHTAHDLIMNLIVMALIAAIGEEFFFRAGMQKIIISMTKNKHVGIWITAIIFSAIHMQFSGFIPRMFLGVFLGYLYVWSGSIWVNISAHFMFNGSQILVQYLQDTKHSNNIVDNVFSSTPGFVLVTLSTLMVIGLVMVIYKMTNNKSGEPLPGSIIGTEESS